MIFFFCSVYVVSVILLSLSIYTRPQEFELFGTKYGDNSRSKKVVHRLFFLLSALFFLGCFGGYIAYLIHNWDQFDRPFWYIIAFLVALIGYYVIYAVFDDRFLNVRDKRYWEEISAILSDNAVYQSALSKVKNGNFKSIYIAQDGIAFFKERKQTVRYPQTQVESDWKKAYHEKYLYIGKSSDKACLKQRCKEWRKALKEQYSSVHSVGCNDFVLFADYGYDGLTDASNFDIRWYLCKELNFKEKTVELSISYFDYYAESYGGHGTIIGSSISYTPPSVGYTKISEDMVFSYKVLVAPDESNLKNRTKTETKQKPKTEKRML